MTDTTVDTPADIQDESENNAKVIESVVGVVVVSIVVLGSCAAFINCMRKVSSERIFH